MKIAIIDDDEWVVRTLKLVAERAGHEVLGIIIWGKKEYNEAPAKVIQFNPDKIFIDHHLSLQEYTGETFAVMLNVAKDKLVGISSDYQQRYCSKRMVDKLNIKTSDEVKCRFLSLIVE